MPTSSHYANVARTVRVAERVVKRWARHTNHLRPQQPPAVMGQPPKPRAAFSWGDFVAAVAIGLVGYIVGGRFWNAFWPSL